MPSSVAAAKTAPHSAILCVSHQLRTEECARMRGRHGQGAAH